MKKLITKYWPEQAKPISDKTLLRIAVVLVVVMSLTAGFYQASLHVERRKYRQLEWEYAKVRSQLLEMDISPVSNL